jgi:hypothetical protein
MHILALATQGAGGDDEMRLRELLSRLPVTWFPFDRSRKLRSVRALWKETAGRRYDLVIVEGTGVGGGLVLLGRRWLSGLRYVVSSGDAVSAFLGSRTRAGWPLFLLYEALLCRFSHGFVGWTPYLTGRALTLGARRAIAVPGWAPHRLTAEESLVERARIRGSLGIPENALVCGVAGSFAWNRRAGYCYGLELVEAARRLRRDDVYLLLVGDGDGRAELQQRAAGSEFRIRFTGRVPRSDIPAYLAAMDVGSLPQSVDNVGSFRYTTKLSEYLAARLPVITSRIPLAYDLDGGWLWRLPGEAPWDPRYWDALASLLEGMTAEQLRQRRNAVPAAPEAFQREPQIDRVTAFIKELGEECNE